MVSNQSDNSEAKNQKGQETEISTESALAERKSDSHNKLIPKPVGESAQAEANHAIFQSVGALLTWTTICLVGFIGLSFILTARHHYSPGFRPGERASRDLVAAHATLVVDEAATKAGRKKALNSVVPVFQKDANADIESINKLNQRLKIIQELQKAYLSSESQPNRKEPSRQSSQSQPRDDQEELIAKAIAPSYMNSFVKIVQAAQIRLCHNLSRLPQDSESEIRQHAFEYLPESMPASNRRLAADLMASSCLPNLIVDEEATEDRRQKSLAAIKPVMKHIDAGQLIVAKNTLLSQANVESLENSGITEPSNWPLVFSLWLSIAAAVALVGLFLYAYEPKHLFSSPSVALMFTLSIAVCGLGTVIGQTYPAFVPLPAVSLLLSIFLGQRVAIAVSLPIAIFLGVDRLVGLHQLLALGTAAGAVMGVYSGRRHSLMAAGIVMSVSQGLAYFLLELFTTHSPSIHRGLQSASQLPLEFAGGLVSAVLAIGSLPFLESIFGMVTPFRLAEMTDADQPLLRRLEENAPGTYQHSLAVANLAEAGARAIGGDVNLVRAGAYYHDVGKLMKPRYFIENQLGDTNPHDAMSPEDSRERVLAHVTDGLVLAKEYNLPKAVQDFIPMHQGTSLMAYFYHKACVRDGAQNVDPAFYRYPGPKPQSKETAIVMLADVSEAVTHSMHDPSQEEVEGAMTKVFQNRWEDGQFSEASLTYAELEKVKKAFVHVWRTLHHDRLKYPSTTTGRMAVPPKVVPNVNTSDVLAN